DGSNGLVVMPVDPLTGNATPGPVVMRYTPSANLGDIDLGALLVERHDGPVHTFRSEEHTSELQSRVDLVCRLLLEKKKNRKTGTKGRSTGRRREAGRPRQDRGGERQQDRVQANIIRNNGYAEGQQRHDPNPVTAEH